MTAALTAASSATGRSDVPAATTRMRPLALREWLALAGNQPGLGVEDGVRHFCPDELPGFGGRPGDEQGLAVVDDVLGDGRDLFRGLPGAQDDLREPLADGAVVVDPGETEVGDRALPEQGQDPGAGVGRLDVSEPDLIE